MYDKFLYKKLLYVYYIFKKLLECRTDTIAITTDTFHFLSRDYTMCLHSATSHRY